ncbi:hypothetical protein HK096_004265, partial [Nowakowskiella sp. JEL0078]
MQDNTVSTLSANGGVLSATNAFVSVMNSQVLRNKLPSGFGGFAYVSGSRLFVNNSNFQGNRAKIAGLVYADYITIQNSIINDTKATQAGCFRVGYNMLVENSQITNSIAVDNAISDCSLCQSIVFKDCYIGKNSCTGTPCSPAFTFLTSPSTTTFNLINSVLEDFYTSSTGMFDVKGSSNRFFQVTVDGCTFRNITAVRGIFCFINAVVPTIFVRNTFFASINALLNPTDYTSPGLLYINPSMSSFSFVADNITTGAIISKSMFHLESNGVFTLRNSQFYATKMYAEFPLIKPSRLGILDGLVITLENNVFIGHQSPILLLTGNKITTVIRDSNFISNTATNGCIVIIELPYTNSTLLIERSVFDDNTAIQSGGIVYGPPTVADLDVPTNNQYIFSNNSFINNRASNGAVMSIELAYFWQEANFNNNLFKNNTASMAGGVFYFTRKAFCPPALYDPTMQQFAQLNYAPYGSYMATDPYNLVLSSIGGIQSNFSSNISLYSGSRLPQIVVTLLDEFGQLVLTPETNILASNLVVLSMESTNTSTLVVDGGICFVWIGKCIFEGQVSGIPGNYNISLSPAVTNFGFLKTQRITIPVTITPCDNGMVSSIPPGSNLPICRAPICMNPCVHGICAGDNCQCVIGYEGPTCAIQILSQISNSTILGFRIFAAVMLGICFIGFIVILFRWKMKVIVDSSKILLFGCILGNIFAFTSIIILDGAPPSTLNSSMVSMLLQRLAFLIIFATYSYRIAIMIGEYSYLPEYMKDETSAESSFSMQVTKLTSAFGKSGSKLNSDVGKSENKETEAPNPFPKTKLIFIATAALVYTGLFIAWFAIPNSMNTDMKQLSDGSFYPDFQNSEFRIAIICLELFLICFMAMDGLRIWKL